MNRMVEVPDLNLASLPWSSAKLLGLKPAGWDAEDFLETVRQSICANPMQCLNVRAAFTGVVANEAVPANFNTPSDYFLGLCIRFDQSNANVSVIGTVQQGGRFPISTTNQPVRLATLFGAATQEPQEILRLLVPDEPLTVALVAEGTPGAAHNVDFAFWGWNLNYERKG